MKLEGPDGLDLLQRISTNDMRVLGLGEHVQSVLTNEKGRVIDVVTVLKTGTESLLLAGMSDDELTLVKWIEKFIVMENVQLASLSKNKTQILLFNIMDMNTSPNLSIKNAHILKLKPLNWKRSLLIVDTQVQEETLAILDANGFVKSTVEDYDLYRLEEGIPGFPNEISTQFNPIEIGLQSLVSFSKGCYVGQEVIARLDTYDKVRRSLRRMTLSVPPRQLPADLNNSVGEKAGILTSYGRSKGHDSGILGLGLVRFDVGDQALSYVTEEGQREGKASILSDPKA